MTAPQAILDAIERGLSIIPLKLDKKPPIPTWKPFQSQLPTREQIEAWAFEFDPPLWAIITGKLSGLIVIDFDGDKGRETMLALGLDPHIQTGSGGYHCYVEYPTLVQISFHVRG
jgi:hypothetical protein